jgi:hypothetical protein
MSGADCLSDQVNYGSRLGEWQPSGGDHVPDGWGEDGVLDGNHDGDYLGMPDLTSFCTICRQIRREEPHLSHVEVRDVQVHVRVRVRMAAAHVRLCVTNELMRVCDAMCRRCANSDPPEDSL